MKNADDDTALSFLKGMRKQQPRYVYKQCERVKRMQKYYTDEQIHIGMEHCNVVNACTVFELSSYLLYRYGEDTSITEHTKHISNEPMKSRRNKTVADIAEIKELARSLCLVNVANGMIDLNNETVSNLVLEIR